MNDSPPSQSSTFTHRPQSYCHAWASVGAGYGHVCIWVLVNIDIDMGRASASTAMPWSLYYTPG